MELISTLKKHFQYEAFREGQEDVIRSVLDGNDTLAMLPTGTGKSLCYQLPGYFVQGKILIVSPLLSLMQDQVEQMKMKGEKRVIAINSFLTPAQKKAALSNLGHYKFIFISPEMLGLESILNTLKQHSISLFVIDEAHCISQWGYDFRPNYLKLGTIRKIIGNPVTLALTATATKEVRQDIKASLELNACNEIIYSVNRPNIAFKIERLSDHSEKGTRVAQLVQQLQGPGIIYFSSKRLAEATAEFLQTNGNLNVMAYHGGMEQEQRILIQQQFLNNQLDVICATSAFGMGVNKDNIRFIIHYHMPLQMESYLQEIGRAGRDGKKSIAILLYVAGDEGLAFNLAEAELPSKEQIEFFANMAKSSPIGSAANSRNELKQYAGFTDNQWRIITDFLEQSALKKVEEETSFTTLLAYVEERLAIKRGNILSMSQFIQSEECRRKMVLRYFEEPCDLIHMEYCCDCCGLDLSNFYKSVSSKNKTIDQVFDWKQYLSQILLK
ncbi:ATP-dependent DNA helicase RecQ [Bacillus sp. T3]|uniref:RecQ family ATP-dependent DNA helicase n=1 Tax=Bacillus sp. T3 TaxID=467262 RepID=UPI002982B49A|nr:ATP-dependent DNA helicase RecQ [Bacillus sp. T3]